MNSHQRRKDRKLWKYSVTLPFRDFDHYTEMWEWLAMRHGKKANTCGWRDRDPVTNSNWQHYDVYDLVTWQFIKERDAIEFTLRWS
ncbi:MAG: hypothetical protein ACOVLB_02025 [Candidatus Nanopelagicus sp.]